MSWIALLGFIAGSITVVGFVPQATKAWRTRRTRDLSFGAFALLASGAVLWLLYGLLIEAWPVVLTNGAILLLIGAILAAKLRFDGDAAADERSR